jgi:hypothetical protein
MRANKEGQILRSETQDIDIFRIKKSQYIYLQVIIKMIALTPKGYWTSRRNRFDMLLTFLGVIWIILHFTFNLTRQEVGPLR